MMTLLPDDIDKTEAGFAWDFTRPAALIAAELLEFYIPEIIKLMFPQWSNGKYLDYLAKMARVERKAPNFATAQLKITGSPGTIIPTGTVFATPATSDSSSIEFAALEDAVIGDDGTVMITVQALVAGLAQMSMPERSRLCRFLLMVSMAFQMLRKPQEEPRKSLTMS